ncbi:MAG: hypothetical protein MI750_13380, partial [Xanthomonadales bacterium]|nr:hypothetical protein [Xanthomonadales bacterium]
MWEAYDSLNRVIETRTQGFKGSSGAQNWIYNSVVYNGRGQTIAESVPEYTLNATHPLTYRYDVLGRQVFKQEPTTDVSNPWRYSHYLHNGLSTQVVVGNDDGSGSSGISCSVANASSALDGDLCVQRTYSSNGWLLSSTDAHGSVTRFWYDAQGNSKIIQDAAGNYTTANYNQLGQRTQLFDPNMGDWSFSYNGLGEVIRQTDARNQSIDFFYDALGRLYRRTVLNTASVELGAFVDEWEYDVAGAGLLHNETRIVGVGNGQSATVFARTYNYDANYRPAGYSVELDPYQYPNATQAADIPVLPLTARYEVGMEYDGYFARVKSVTYPQERFRLYQRYDQNGYLWQEGDSRNQSQVLKSVTAMNPANQVTAETFGNGSTQIYQHH